MVLFIDKKFPDLIEIINFKVKLRIVLISFPWKSLKEKEKVGRFSQTFTIYVLTVTYAGEIVISIFIMPSDYVFQNANSKDGEK